MARTHNVTPAQGEDVASAREEVTKQGDLLVRGAMRVVRGAPGIPTDLGDPCEEFLALAVECRLAAREGRRAASRHPRRIRV